MAALPPTPLPPREGEASESARGDGAPAVVRGPSAVPAIAPAAGPSATRSMPLDVAAVWAEVNRIATSSRRLRAVLSDLRLASLDATGALLEGSTLAVSAARAVQGELASAFQQACGRTISISLRAAEGSEGADGASTGGNGVGNASRAPSSAEDMRKHPLVTAAEELFGARLVRVDPRQGGL